MRMIDANALIAEMHNVILEDGEDRRIFYEVIERQPTVEERKRGEWIEDAETFYKAVNEKGGGVNEDTPYFTKDDVACSECLTLFNVLENRTDIFDFCPNCGADMRQGGQDE